ncbi:MAG: hypothetical protein ACT4RN_13195 [Pseudonocardia sp.]
MLDGAGAHGGAVATPDADDMAVFVDRLAAAGSDRPTTLAATQIRRRIDAGAAPPGIRKLAEGLAAAASEPPQQRLPADEPASVVAAVEVRNLVVLEDHAPADVATAVAALLAAGRRVVVTGPSAPGLDAVRAQLPAEAAARATTRLPAMLPAELRELRRLLVTDTPSRQARPGQQLPPEDALLPLDRMAGLCERARHVTDRPGNVVAHLLKGVDPERMDAVVGVAHCVLARLGALGPREEGAWTWDLLADLVIQRHRATFDRLREEVAQAADTVAAIDGSPPVAFVAPLTEHGIQALFDYLEYLQDGGRPRSFFRTHEQREVQPVLAQIRVGGHVPETARDVGLILRHRELAERMGRIGAYCTEIGVPPPRDAAVLPALVEDLDKVAAATRSMGALRHDVLFLRADSPIAPPDVTQAEQVAREILAFVDRTPVIEAEQELDRAADTLADLADAHATAPEHEQAVAALRARDVDGYGEALDALCAARREQCDGQRSAALLTRLRAAAPSLADAWTAPGAAAAGLGMVCLVSVDALLAQLPPADAADVVLVVGAAGLGVERLLLAAAAPRVVVAVGPGESAGEGPSLLSVLRRAGALVIRSDTAGPVNGRVVQLARAMPAQRQAQVG